VVLKLRSGQSAAQDVVQGVQHLVASSIDGLETQKVTVLDDSGRLLSLPDEPGSIAALSSRQLLVQREVESYLEQKAEEIVGQVVGAGNVRVRVSASMNFDRVERTTEMLDPDRQVLAAEQRSEIIPGAEGGAGSSTTSANYENSRSMESFSGATGNVKRISVAVLVNEKDPAGGAEGVVAEPRTAQELAQIEALVRGAVGVDDTRGDVVSVASLAFSTPARGFVEPTPDVWTLVERFHRPGLTLIALLLAAFVALRAFRALREPTLEESGAALALESGASAASLMDGEEDVAALAPAPEEEELAPMLVRRAIPSTNARTRNEVTRSVQEQPEAAVRVVRAWLREA
jgi:flagellar M-ring protein FliF